MTRVAWKVALMAVQMELHWVALLVEQMVRPKVALLDDLLVEDLVEH